jgi:hypothetical protein
MRKKLILMFAVFAILGCQDSGGPPQVAPLYYPACRDITVLAAETMADHGHEVRIVSSHQANHLECQAVINGQWKWIRLGGSQALGFGVAAYDKPTVPMPDAEYYTYQQWKTWGILMIKNYTSTVPAERSVMHIEKRLVAHGAKNILKQYGPTGKLSGVCFIIEVNGQDTPFKIPARVEKAEERLRSQIKKPRAGTMKKIADQAERTAWKIVSDWVDIQMSLIDLDQVELIEVFLPYVYDPSKEQTFFERIKEGGYKLLPGPK